MKKILFLLAAVLTFAGFSACSSDEPQVSDETTRTDNSVDYLNITYNGVTYNNVPTKYDKNNNFVFLDNKFAPIYRAELADCPTLSINLTAEKTLTIYKTLEENLEDMGLGYIGVLESQSLETRSLWPSLGILKLFDDRNFLDRRLDFVLQNGYVISEPNLGINSYKFNDKCSSLIVQNYIETNETSLAWAYSEDSPSTMIQMSAYDVDVVFVGYENSNYGGHTITVVCAPSHTEPRSTLPGFNDKLSSFKLFAAQIGVNVSNI